MPSADVCLVLIYILVIVLVGNSLASVFARGGLLSRPFQRPLPSSLILYEVYLRGFCHQWAAFDIDYIHSLGCNAVWLTPIHPSPSSHGYDVTNYFNVHSDFGTLHEFYLLVQRFHARGMRVFIDMVLNHTSEKHPWFEKALREPLLTDPFRQCFHFSATPPTSSPSMETAAWYQHKHDTQSFWYRAAFGPQMPDWNLANRRVCRHHRQVASFWLVEIGVDGFRMDAVKALVYSLDQTPRLGSWQWLQKFYAWCRRLKPSVCILGELTMCSAVIATAQARGVMDLGFEFSLTEAIYASITTKSALPLVQMLALLGHLYPNRGASYVTFLSNHDQDRVASRVGRLEVALATVIWLSLPGAPCVYYGDEVGMQGCCMDTDRRRPIWETKPTHNMSLCTLYKVMLEWRKGIRWETFTWKASSSSRLLLSWTYAHFLVIDMKTRVLHSSKELHAICKAYNICRAHACSALE